MAATYATDFSYPLNRVRMLVFDKAAPFRWQNEEIYYQLTRSGYEGDPAEPGPEQRRPELVAAIALIESVPDSASGGTGASTTIKQGSVTRTSSDGFSGTFDRKSILRNLYRQLSQLDAVGGIGAGPVVEDGYAGVCW